MCSEQKKRNEKVAYNIAAQAVHVFDACQPELERVNTGLYQWATATSIKISFHAILQTFLEKKKKETNMDVSVLKIAASLTPLPNKKKPFGLIWGLKFKVWTFLLI